MSYTVKNVNGCTKKFEFNFPTIDLTNEIKTQVLKKQQTSNVKGFRKGKAPIAIVEKIYGPEIESNALNQFVQAQIFEAVNKEKYRMVGYPNFENVKYDSGKSMSFDAVVEVFPEVKISDFSSYSFKKDKVEVSEEDLTKNLKNYLSSKAETIEITDPGHKIVKGDIVVFNFEGLKEDGSRPENMKAKDFLLEIGSGQFIPGFEDGMIGLKKGVKHNIPLVFPKDYHVPELQNSKVTFEVEVLEIKEKKYPELTEELAKEFGYDSVQSFHEKNKANLLAQKERQANEKLHQEILEKLVKENSFDVPKTLIKNQEGYLKEDLTKTLKSQGFDDFMVEEYFNRWQGDVTTKAEFQVRSGLILDFLAKEYKIEATESDFDKKIEESAKTSGLDVNMMKKYYTSNQNIKSNMMFAIREEKTFDEIKKKIKIS